MRVEYMVDEKTQWHVQYSPGNPLREATITLSRFSLAADEMLELNFRSLGHMERFLKDANAQYWRIKNEIIERAQAKRKGARKHA